MKAIVLAAGLGTRLRPITDLLPKPLVPILGHPLLEIAIQKLLASGATKLGVNAFYLPEKIVAFSKRYQAIYPLKVSIEAPEILGSGGALMPFKTWMEAEPVIVYNGDILSELNFSTLFEAHEATKSFVTMAVRQGHNGKDRAVWVRSGPNSGEFEIVDIAKDRPLGGANVTAYTFASAYVMDSRLLDYLPSTGPSDVIEGIRKALKQGLKVTPFLCDGFWADVGTPQSLWDTTVALLRLTSAKQKQILGLVDTHVTPIDPSTIGLSDATISGTVVIERGCQIGAGAKISDSILLPEAVVAPNEIIHQKIVGPHQSGYRISVG